MSFTTLEQYYRDYRVKNGQVPSEAVLNKGPMRLKREIRELESMLNIALGIDLPEWNQYTRYEVDEYISYNNQNYKSLLDGNFKHIPDESPMHWKPVNIIPLDSRYPVGSLQCLCVKRQIPGYLLCDGSEVLRNTYLYLFSVIGTSFGAGDGSTTFNLPKYNEPNKFYYIKY
jgi:hypothetical protein